MSTLTNEQTQGLTPGQVRALEELERIQNPPSSAPSGILPWLARKGAAAASSYAGNVADLFTLFPRLKEEQQKYEAIKRLEKFGFEPEDQIYKNELAQFDREKTLADRFDTRGIRNLIDRVTGGYTEAKPDETLSDKFFGITGGILGGSAVIKGGKQAIRGAKWLVGGTPNITLNQTKALVTTAEKGGEIGASSAAQGISQVSEQLMPFMKQLGRAAGLGGVGTVSSEMIDRTTRNPTVRTFAPLLPMTLYALTMPRGFTDKGLSSAFDETEAAFSREKTISPKQQVEAFKDIDKTLSRIKTPEAASYRKLAEPAQKALKELKSKTRQGQILHEKGAKLERQILELQKTENPNPKAIKKLQENLAKVQRDIIDKRLTDEMIKEDTYTSEHQLFLDSKMAKNVQRDLFTKQGLSGKGAAEAKRLVSDATARMRNQLIEEVERRDPALAARYKQLNEDYRIQNSLGEFQQKVKDFWQNNLSSKIGKIGVVSDVKTLFSFLGKTVLSPAIDIFRSYNAMKRLAQSKALRNYSLQFFKAVRGENARAAISAASGISKEMEKMKKKEGRFSPVGKLSSDFFKEGQ